MSERLRLDLALEARGLLPSRSRARDAIKRGTVRVNGITATKPHQTVAENDEVILDDPASGYVSRAALKLIAGLEAGNIDVNGRVCLDVGSSTGGFTQVLLERGANRVFAVDVGHDQLHQSLCADPRVVSLEGTNARALTREQVPDAIGLLACDISFVSVTKVLTAPLALCRPGADAVILFKPQFEVGREHIGKGGIVTEKAAMARGVSDAIAFVADHGWTHDRSIASPIAGGDGNMETVMMFTKDPE